MRRKNTLSLIHGENKTYLSLDVLCSKNGNRDTPNDVHTPEFLKTIVTYVLLNHNLKLKVGVPIMLLRNTYQSS